MYPNNNQNPRHNGPQYPNFNRPSRGNPRGGYQNDFYRGAPKNQPVPYPPPPPASHMTPGTMAGGPLQLTLTINPEQLMPRHHHHHHHHQQLYDDYGIQQRMPNDHYDNYNETQSPQSESFYDDPPPPYSASSAPSNSRSTRHLNDRNTNQRGRSSARHEHNASFLPPPPYSPGNGLLATPQSRDLAVNDMTGMYPQELQSRSRLQERQRTTSTSSSNFESSAQQTRGRGGGRGRGRGRGNFQGKGLKSSGSLNDVSDQMPLGCEASRFKKNEVRSRNKYKDGVEKEDDDASVQSVPNSGRNAVRGAQRAKRGFRGAGRRGARGRGVQNNRRASNSVEGFESQDEQGEDISDSESIASSISAKAKYARDTSEHNKDPQYGKKSSKMTSKPAPELMSKTMDQEDTSSVGSNTGKTNKHDKDKPVYKKEPKTNVKSNNSGSGTSQFKSSSQSYKYKKGKDEKFQSKHDKKLSEEKKKAGGDDFKLVAKRLNVSLKLKKTLESYDDFKTIVQRLFEFPKCAKFELEFTSEPLLDDKNVHFKFSILTNNVWMAKKCVKIMIEKLRGKLKTFIQYISAVDTVLPTKNRQVEKEKRGLPNSKDTTDDTKQKAGDNNKEKPALKAPDHEPLKGNIPEMCPVSFLLSMEKPFARVEGCIDFVTTIVNHFSSIEEFEIKEDLVVLNTTSSQCVIYLKSKADARRLSKTLFKFQKETKLDMKYEVTKIKEETKSDDDAMSVWKTRIQKILNKMKAKNNDIISGHDEKLSSLRRKIESLEQSENVEEHEIEAEKNAVEDKLTEALNQRMEFLCKCKSISKTLLEANLCTTKEKELNRIQEEFGIECQRLTNALPIYARREDIVSHVKSNQVSILLGETGSGKSTQIAQYLYEAGVASDDGVIVCTQPRKVAALQLADRVAQEMAVRTGDLVGYKTGNKRKMTSNTKIVFTTDHSLLNECLNDREFQKYSCIIVDEAHERSIYTDILLGMIKVCLNKRPDLRVVITSATIDPQVFIDYFQCPKEISVSGRTFPVEVCYMESSDDFENYETKAVHKAAEIHRTQAEGDILVFLTSPVEIQRCCEEFCKMFKDQNDFKCLPLHGQLLAEEQKKVFSKLAIGVRKVVFATNCAETSITIDGIRYVIDTGVSKEMRYDAKKNLNLLGVHMISQSSANQRKGRAGRTASGKCYRLFSEDGYNAMRTINEPEILRVHLGQAILKLAELGVNIRDYDFVESPSDSALQAALETLEFLGAIEDEKITDMGRWISKLPFDPKLGYIVYKASKDGLLYDAIVLASVVSNGSGLFYRGLTETEAQISARSKAQFGLESGDIFTWYTIYKIWEAKQTSKEKRQWCQSNCINYKSMNYTKTCIDEVITALKHEMGVDVLKEFSDEPSSMTVLSKLILRAYGLSLCHFMGHNRAGYFSLCSQRQVHLHPSSTLVAQNLQPEWLVFVELVKTSREFIKGILVVDEEWIQEAIDEGHLDVNITEAKEGTLAVVHKEELGVSVFRAIVGPRYSNLKHLEDLCETFGMKHPIVEADREVGTVSIYSSSPRLHQDILKHMKEIKSEAMKKLEKEESECKIFGKEANDSPNIRAVLGSGACVRQILLPHQTTEVLLRKVGDATEEDISMKFGEFGNILEIIKFKSDEPWGFLRYRSVEEALIAAERTKRDETLVGTLRLGKADNTKNMFQAKVSWLRRPVKGDGTAFIKVDPMDKPDLIGRNIVVNGTLKMIYLSRKDKQKKNGSDDFDGEQDLIVFKTGEITEEDIRDGIIAMSGRNINIKRITIPRDQVPAPSQKELESIKTRLMSLIDPNEVERFNVWVSKPDAWSVYHTAFLYFTDPVRGLHICKRLNRRIRIEGQIVKISPSLKTTILVPKKIKDACKEQMDELFSSMKRDLGVNLEWKKLREDHAIAIQCENPEGIVKARECITEELKGETIDCNITKPCLCFLTAAGQEYLKLTQKNTGCVIISDKRTKKIHFYGKPSKVSQAKIEINKYFTDESRKDEIFKLKSWGKPPGLMKALMGEFGPLLDGLIQEYKLSSVTLDCRSHILKCSGSEVSIEELSKYVSLLENRLFDSNHAGSFNRIKPLPDCVVCLDDVEKKEDLYRLEVCGHPYCILCLQHQTLACVQNNQFPLICADENCGKELVWKDLRFIFGKRWITEEKLIHAALNYLVNTQSERYKHCPTPNCPVVYEVTLDENGFEFNCDACFASTCSSCHLAFHAGVSCKMAKSVSNAEDYLDGWCAADPKMRKICPGCKCPTEKTEGCNNMHCTSCNIVFCWICLKMFEDSQKCYAHLAEMHGGFFGD